MNLLAIIKYLVRDNVVITDVGTERYHNRNTGKW